MTASRGQWIAVAIILTILGGALTIGVALSDDLFPVAVGSRAPEFQAVNIATGGSAPRDSGSSPSASITATVTSCRSSSTSSP
jgi:hypothetical protein